MTLFLQFNNVGGKSALLRQLETAYPAQKLAQKTLGAGKISVANSRVLTSCAVNNVFLPGVSQILRLFFSYTNSTLSQADTSRPVEATCIYKNFFLFLCTALRSLLKGLLSIDFT